MAMDARAYSHDSYSYSGDDTHWRDANGRMCSWTDQTWRGNDGGMNHRWVQDCH